MVPKAEAAPSPALYSPRLRVLLLIPSLGFGGAEFQITYLALGLARRGEQVTLAVMEPLVQSPAPLTRAGVRVVALDAANRRAKAWAIRRVARLARSADVVHCTRWDAGLWGRVAALTVGTPVTVGEHASERFLQITKRGAPRARVIGWHHRLLAPFTAATVACGRSQLDLLLSEGVPSEQLAIVPNGIPLETVRRSASAGTVTRAEIGVPDDARIVMQVGRLTAQKNQVATLDAVAALRTELGDVHAVFVGDGEDGSARERAAAREIDWAHFLGARTDVPALLALADLAVLPSLTEALPMAALEAIAVGVPQVVTDVGDLGELIRESGAGTVVPARDLPAFTAACRDLLADPAAWRRQADRARESAPRWDVAPMVESYAALLAAAAAHEPLPAASSPWRS